MYERNKPEYHISKPGSVIYGRSYIHSFVRLRMHGQERAAANIITDDIGVRPCFIIPTPEIAVKIAMYLWKKRRAAWKVHLGSKDPIDRLLSEVNRQYQTPFLQALDRLDPEQFLGVGRK